jgi:hypothetical protein
MKANASPIEASSKELLLGDEAVLSIPRPKAFVAVYLHCFETQQM